MMSSGGKELLLVDTSDNSLRLSPYSPSVHGRGVVFLSIFCTLAMLGFLFQTFLSSEGPALYSFRPSIRGFGHRIPHIAEARGQQIVRFVPFAKASPVTQVTSGQPRRESKTWRNSNEPAVTGAVGQPQSWQDRLTFDVTAYLSMAAALLVICGFLWKRPVLKRKTTKLTPLDLPLPGDQWAMMGTCGYRPLQDYSCMRQLHGHTVTRLYSSLSDDDIDEDVRDVEMHLMNYLTYKSVRIVLEQLVETDMSPMKADYMWLRQFCLDNSLTDAEAFLKKLATTRPQFAQRILETRLQVFKDWSKQFEQGKMEQRLKDSDLRVLKYQLNQNVRLSSDRPDDNIQETRE